MENNILQLYLKRVANGDRSYLERLCRIIADTIVYVPVQKSSSSTEQAVLKVKVPRLPKKAVPVFTSPEHFASWSKKNGSSNELLSVVLGHLCLALEDSAGVHINPQSEESVEIGSRYKQLIVEAME